MAPNVFALGARAYDLLTSHAPWREQAAGLLAHVPAASGIQRVLDLGCGPGMSAFGLAGELPRARVVGLELVPQMLSRARRHQGTLDRAVEFVQADASRIPCADGAFDLVTGHSFLYLVSDPEGVLREARRVLRPGGFLVLMEPSTLGSLRRAVRWARPVQLLERPFASLRFAIALALWRFYSQTVGRISPERAEALLHGAGFTDVGTAPTLGGLGLHCFGRA